MPRFMTTQNSLLGLVQEVLSDLRLDHSISVEIDVSDQISIPIPSPQLTVLVRALIEQAVDAIDGDGNLLITGWESQQVCELEVADDGPSVDQRDCKEPVISKLSGAELLWQDCPQGGAAVTARFCKQIAQRKVA